ncbi:sugar phosphate isomerase/epimerase [Candidatus Pelagibacter sp.]|nr:sugar phosphate isomerase/epimerase [Candidatus Pelagibacter sp.]
MKLLISNLAWNYDENEKFIKLLKKNKITNLEFAPSKLLQNNFKSKNLIITKNFWKKNGIKLYSMQSILYGIDDCFLFGSKKQRSNFIKEIFKKIDLAKKLGVKVIVFGSPTNRKRFKKKKNILDKIFLDTLKKVASYTAKKKIYFCLEANPKIYKSEYLNYTKDALKIVKRINNKYLMINLDLSTVIQNKETINDLINQNIKYIKHVQISVPYLLNVLKYKNRIRELIKLLKFYKYNNNISIEMIRPRNNPYKTVQKIIVYIKKLF